MVNKWTTRERIMPKYKSLETIIRNMLHRGHNNTESRKTITFINRTKDMETKLENDPDHQKMSKIAQHELKILDTD